jgi:phage terminase large subunit
MALVVLAAQKPLRVLCAREVQKSIRDSVKRLLDDKIDSAGFRSMFKSTDSEIRGTNGSLFIFAGLQHNIASIKSMEGIDLCWCEEAQTLSVSSIETLLPTIRKPGSKIFFSWNPKNPKDPVDAMFKGEEGPPPKSLVKCVNYSDNPWFPDVLREEMEHDKLKDHGKYLHTWEGQYLVRSNANVFQDWRIEDFKTPKDAFFRFGADWGFSVDPTTLIRCFTEGRKLYFDQEAYQVGCEIDDTPELFATVPESDRWPIIADSASPERISYMRKHGYPKMMKALKGRKSIEEGISFMQSFEIIVHPRCEHIIQEMMEYKYKIDPITEEITNVLEDKNNHCIDAARYSLEAVRRTMKSKKKVEFTPLPSTNFWS